MKDIFIFVSYFVIVFCIVMLIRNQLVYKYRMRKIDEVDALAKKLIEQGDINYLAPFDTFDKLSYTRMLFQFHKWTYNAFYK